MMPSASGLCKTTLNVPTASSVAPTGHRVSRGTDFTFSQRTPALPGSLLNDLLLARAVDRADMAGEQARGAAAPRGVADAHE